MKVSGFTIVRNGVKYFYPFIEAIKSILPLCDEFIINVGDSEDGTFESVKSIKDSRIKIIENKWDMTLREDGKVLSVETNKTLQECSGDWCFYIQSDEVLHEKYIPAVKAAMDKYLNKTEVEALKFRYKHFYGSYDYYQDNNRKWYPFEIRIIRGNKNIVSWGDAMSFRHRDETPVKAVPVNAEIYHYGWVKPPDTMLLKRIDFHKLYHADEEVERYASSATGYNDLGNLKRFENTHPKIMTERIKLTNWDFDAKLELQHPDWLRKIIIFFEPLTKRVKNYLNKINKNIHKT
jgi:hypothetical protein